MENSYDLIKCEDSEHPSDLLRTSPSEQTNEIWSPVYSKCFISRKPDQWTHTAHIRTYTCTQMCIHTHTHTHMCMHTHTHICVRIHTHTQTHTCTCMMHKERKKETNKQTTSCKEYATVQLIDLN